LNSHGKNRHSRAIIDLQALRDNYRLLKQKAGGNRLIAVVKADAYGHGAVEVARALGEADAFAVAAVGEALALREAGVTGKILALGGFVHPEELQACVDHQIDPVLHHQFHLDCLRDMADLKDIDVWLKVDSGMGRLGFALDSVREITEFLTGLDTLGNLRMMTHLANADAIDNSFTEFQMEQVNSLGLEDYEWGIANSAGILGWPETHGLWVRAGIALYGADPMSDRKIAGRQLRPSMTMVSVVLAIYSRNKGDMIGCANTYTCPDDMTIAVVATGYADGYPRHKVGAVQVLVKGQLCELVGRVSMDMITVDVSQVADLQVGDEVTLFGGSPDINDIADSSETIAYEILCNVGAHVSREYLD
jgi:alanine racemase